MLYEDRDVTVAGFSWKHRLHEAADRALATDRPVEVGHFVLVPDVLLTQAYANRLPTPGTWRLARGDGRSVNIYRLAPARS